MTSTSAMAVKIYTPLNLKTTQKKPTCQQLGDIGHRQILGPMVTSTKSVLLSFARFRIDSPYTVGQRVRIQRLQKTKNKFFRSVNSCAPNRLHLSQDIVPSFLAFSSKNLAPSVFGSLITT